VACPGIVELLELLDVALVLDQDPGEGVDQADAFRAVEGEDVVVLDAAGGGGIGGHVGLFSREVSKGGYDESVA
jgi:hypothetical protein